MGRTLPCRRRVRMNGFRHAWAFLTRLRGGLYPDSDEKIASAVVWFPVVGAVVGAITAGAYLGMLEFLDPFLAAFVAVALSATVTGAFHEDGLADTADALGGATQQRRLEIMSDSRIGTFGALALILVTLGKVGALESLSGIDALIALIGAHALGRAGALALMLIVGPARSAGLGAAYTTHLPRRGVTAVVVVVCISAALSGVAGLVVTGAVLWVVSGMAVLAKHRFGGLTGDVLGATEQLGELVVLVALSQLSGAPAWF